MNPQFRMFPGLATDLVPVDLTVARVTPQGKVRPYPLSVTDEILKRPLVLMRFAASLCLNRIAKRPMINAESHAIYHISKYLYRRSGLQNYLRRFYGIDPKEVNLHFVNRRMNLAPISNVRSTARQVLQRLRGRQAHVYPKCHAFARPIEGFHAYYAKWVDALRESGIDIRCAVGLKAVRRVDRGQEIITAAGSLVAKRVINTLPLEKIFNLLSRRDVIEISSTKLCTLCCSFAGQRGFDSVVLYNFHESGSWKRLTMHSDYYGTRKGREFFSVEVTLRDKTPEPQSLFEDFAAHMRQVGLFRGDLRLEGHRELDFAYPICDMQAEARRLQLIEILDHLGIETIGRQGLFDYIPHSSVAIEAVQERFGEGAP